MDQASLLQVYHRHEKELLRYLTRRLQCVAAAADVAHDLYVKLLEGAAAPPVTNPKGYLFRMAANLATDYQREARRRGEIENEIAALLWREPEGRTPERHALAEAEVACLRRAVAGLPERSRRIFFLNRFHGKSQREIARELSVSQTTVENHMRRVMATLAAARAQSSAGGNAGGHEPPPDDSS